MEIGIEIEEERLVLYLYILSTIMNTVSFINHNLQRRRHEHMLNTMNEKDTDFTENTDFFIRVHLRPIFAEGTHRTNDS